jgi:hypothetical protein
VLGQDYHPDHSNHGHSAHDHEDDYHDFDPSNTNEALANLRRSLRGQVLPIGKRRRVQGANYAYWVDVYIEIDRDLCSDNSELVLCDAGTIGPNTINYGERSSISERVGWNCSEHNFALTRSIMCTIILYLHSK